eukprot:NODE_3339_length_784_cov_106.021769_g2790_i0.p3 GENE.NODE_3339_length_784_cov_106.021769_g2790_i0~~NODE_3339_length_784_cov_106.021769_g2790_i0.p3  ORF type:complete len:56 (-),score=3.76 NODE_3339_length_784_cov_106.021769_g2790_i0:44-211(-)
MPTYDTSKLDWYNDDINMSNPGAKMVMPRDLKEEKDFANTLQDNLNFLDRKTSIL